jgi:hypothetical protein
MKASGRPDHRALAETLRRQVLEGPGETPPQVRQAAAQRAAGGPPSGSAFDDLARQVGEAAFRVTDAQVQSVVAATGSERATFEIIVAAALGAGLSRWRLAMKALDEASHAAS